jgi:hypothetical protein
MEPNQSNGNQANDISRLIELYDLLGYNLSDLPSSVEGIDKVHTAKSAPIFRGSLHSFFVQDEILHTVSNGQSSLDSPSSTPASTVSFEPAEGSHQRLRRSTLSRSRF